MAYVSDSVSEQFSAATSYTLASKPEHESGDLLYAFISEDVGTGTLAITGWTEVTTQAASDSQRGAMFYKVAASSNEAMTFTSSVSAAVNICVMTIKGADTADVVNGANRLNTSGNSGVPASPSLTTDEDNCLLLYGWTYDGGGDLNVQPADLVCVAKEDQVTQLIVGYRNQLTAGAIPTVTARCAVATEGGTALVVAINDDGTGKKAPQADTYNILRRYGLPGEVENSTNTDMAARSMAGTSIASIDGISVSSSTPTIDNPSDLIATWSTMSRIRWTAAPGAGLSTIHGTYDAISATDFTGKIISLQWAATGVSAALLGSRGYFIGFEDSTGEYAVFQLSERAGILQVTSYTSFIAPDVQTPYEESGAIDWTDITKIIYCYERVETNTGAHGIQIKDFSVHTNTVLTGGSADFPATPTFLPDVLEGWGQYLMVGVSGDDFIVNKAGLQIGDGTRPTYFKSTKSAYTLPVAYGANIKRRFWQVPADATEIRIKASASDEVDMSASLVVTPTKQAFIVDSTSSTSATYNFSGLVLSGYEVTGKTGVTFNGVTFDSCYQIDLAGGGLSNASVTNSLDTPAVTTTDPAEIVNTEFISAGTGHAIEATAIGTYAFEGNTFSGYGADGTTDAAFYNNSGGLITLQIPAGETAPTVLNGTGASTVIDTPVDNQQVTLTNLVIGSRVQIYDLTSATELLNIVADATTEVWTDASPYAADREIRVRVARQSTDTAKEFIEVNIGTLTSTDPQVIYRVNQVDDAVYNTNAIDGSAVANVTIDDSVLLAEIDTGSMSWQSLYAYEVYWLTTETGIRDEGQLIQAVDVVNYLFDDLTIVNVTSPEVPLVMTGGYARNLTSGLTQDVFDTSLGSIFNAPDHVIGYAFGSGVTNQDKIDIRDGLAMETNATSNKEEILTAQKLPNLLIKDKLS